MEIVSCGLTMQAINAFNRKFEKKYDYVVLFILAKNAVQFDSRILEKYIY
jgi:hypothetical protein